MYSSYHCVGQSPEVRKEIWVLCLPAARSLSRSLLYPKSPLVHSSPTPYPSTPRACSLTTSGVMSGTSLMENLPITFLGITVLAPDPEKAPSIPWRERDGYRHLCIRMSVCRKREWVRGQHEAAGMGLGGPS